MRFETRKTWLEAASLFTLIFGLLIAAAALPAAQAFLWMFIDIVFWPLDGAQTLAASESRLLSAISGGVLAGWGATLWLLVRRLFVREPALVKSIILTGAITWFVIDSTGSVAAGAPLNAVLNIASLLLFLIPLRGPIARESHI